MLLDSRCAEVDCVSNFRDLFLPASQALTVGITISISGILMKCLYGQGTREKDLFYNASRGATQPNE